MSWKLSNGRLSEAGVRRIHELRAARHSYQLIAAEVGVAIGTVYNVVKGRTWRDYKPTIDV